MNKDFQFVKSWFVNFKLNMCCWFAPVKIGLLLTAYINIILAYISLIGIADESFAPPLVQVQQKILEDYATKPIPILAYATELAFSVVLLCGLFRNDIPLLRVYMLYSISAIITSVLVYSMVVAAIGAIITVALVLSILFQVYILIMVRSLIVKMTLAEKNGIDLIRSMQKYEVYRKPEVHVETPVVVETSVDVETPADVETPMPQEPETGTKNPETRLQTVDESPKEDITIEKK